MTDEKLQFILDNLQESLEVEVKNWLSGLGDRDSQAKLAREIIALANHGGGYVVIGFDDENLGELEPEAGHQEAFTQDAIAQLVQRYVMPPCQCTVMRARKTGSDIEHPVIVVPGNHRTPLFAKRGNEGNDLESETVYVRRPGGFSEPARTQDDWEKLLDRLVMARQSELITAIRGILDPPSIVLPEIASLEDWQSESYAKWAKIVSEFDANDPRRLPGGEWTAAFLIDPFETESLAELAKVLDREMPKHSGWPPFTYLHGGPKRPRPENENTIEAYLGHLEPDQEPREVLMTSDYWRVARDGRGFLLRPMMEDVIDYPGPRYPAPQGPFFDWLYPIGRMTEILKFIETLGGRFGGREARFELMLTYYNTNGRHLEVSAIDYALPTGAACNAPSVNKTIVASISDISTNLEELVFSLLAPVYEQFDFATLDKALVTDRVRKQLAYPR